MIMIRTSMLLGISLAAGCFAKQSIADNPVETDGDTAGDTVGDTEGDDVADDEGGGDTIGATGEMPGPVIEGGAVDCSTLPPNGPIVAGWDLTTLGFADLHCNPRVAPSDPANTEYACCSVDPAAPGGALPAYLGKGIEGELPYFAGANNSLGTWGACVRTAEIPFGSGLMEAAARNCPVPCNPTWADDDIAEVCGTGRTCCQVHELRPEDCVIDPDSGQWRPVTGADVGQTYDDGTPITDWSAVAHATHQDPNGNACIQIAGGSPSGPAFTECVAALTVADQRGFCMALGPGQACPHEDPGYVDACEQL